jgi:hypothetical protein
METRILGIVGNTLYIQGFYAGDNSHQLFIPEYELQAFIDAGIPVYDDIDYIYCQEHGMTYDQYKEYLNKYNKEY